MSGEGRADCCATTNGGETFWSDEGFEDFDVNWVDKSIDRVGFNIFPESDK